MPDIKLTYFETTGIAEAVRLILSYARQPFIDERITLDDWLDRKSEMPFGQVPVIEIDGKRYHQSMAIARYLAKQYGLAGKDDKENMEIDSIAYSINDFRIFFTEVLWDTNPEEKARKRDIVIKEKIPYFLEKFEKIIEENGGFFYGNRVTWADLMFVSLQPYFEVAIGFDILQEYPFLKEYADKISEIPGIKEWISKRPKKCCIRDLNIASVNSSNS
ncbi:glutathione S-transferase [Orussus abietinus]|uniref:glutathione S-transferase n=1 Tax=Orussus abietinus TaxID=222816 RepID=UPI0006261647|nr:glutathione S-transferase [Orussus abietinus]